MAGRKINDHSSWVGSAKPGYVFPDGPHKAQATSSAQGVGEVSRYEDSDEAVKGQQKENNKLAKSRPMKPGYRN